MIDSHCHLDFDTFDANRPDVIQRAERAGVHTIINIGVDMVTSLRSIELAAKHNMIYATVGFHPHDAKHFDDASMAELEKLAGKNKVVAIGEIGLDYYRDHSPRPAQQKAFARQLELAARLKLPVVVHTRDAFESTLAIIQEYAADLPGGVFHCFPGDAREASMIIDLGFVVGVGGVVTYKNSGMARMASEIPLDRILLETDAPFLTPVPYRGKTNEPAYVAYVRDKLAELRGISQDEVEKITDRTCRKLFGLVETFGG